MPSLTVQDEGGGDFDLRSLEGKAYVLYFYPKDDTPGCTREAQGFRDRLQDFGAAQVAVLGVSPDKPATHQRFRDKYGLPFTLLSDPAHELAEACGVWVEKHNYGRTSMGISRTTFLVDPSGKVARVWRNVKVDGHVDAVLAAARELRTGGV